MDNKILLKSGYIIVFILQQTVSFNFGDPPRIEDVGDRTIFGHVGDVIKLPCRVNDNDAMSSWTKDGESINLAWLRFKVLMTQLRIKDAVEDDSGVYTCTATNGFGTDDVTYRLYVLGNNTEIPSSLPEGTLPPLPTAKRAPTFDRPDQMVARKQAPAGSNIRLKCHASGVPDPQITWYKDGRPIHAPYYESRDVHEDQWVLILNDLRVVDSGSYKCVVMNIVGTIQFTYSLAVIGLIDSNTRPVIKDPHPVNTTVQYGDMASFQCKVNSQVPPTIQWLKRVDSVRDVRHRNNTIEIEGKYYIVLQTEVSVKDKENGLYMNKLIIPSATTQDAGKYICLGTNGIGHSMKDAYLTVLDGTKPHGVQYGDQPNSIMDDHSLLLLIAIPAVVVVVVASVAVYCLCKKQKVQEPAKTVLHSSAPRTHSKSKSNNTPPDKRPTGYEHQYTAMHPQMYNHYVTSPQAGYNVTTSPQSGYSTHLVSAMPSGQDRGVYLKNYGGLHTHGPTPSDVSSSGQRSATPPHVMHAPVQHTHAHYQNCVT